MRDGGGDMWVWHAESRVLREPIPLLRIYRVRAQSILGILMGI